MDVFGSVERKEYMFLDYILFIFCQRVGVAILGFKFVFVTVFANLSMSCLFKIYSNLMLMNISSNKQLVVSGKIQVVCVI